MNKRKQVIYGRAVDRRSQRLNRGRQKINYIHLNTLRERWQFVEKHEDYPYSSCRYYENGLDCSGL